MRALGTEATCLKEMAPVHLKLQAFFGAVSSTANLMQPWSTNQQMADAISNITGSKTK